MSDVNEALEALQNAQQTVDGLGEELTAAWIAAKQAYRDDPSPENLVRREEASDAITAYRNVVRAHRGGIAVQNPESLEE
jgi:hypothetical protein